MAAVIEIGSTYNRKVGDNIEAVTIDRPCDFGGWYGTNSNGNSVRVTEKSLILSDNNKEDNHMASNARVTAADRRARRGVAASGDNKLVIEISDSGAAAIEEATGGGVKAADLKAAVAKQPAAKKTAAKPAAKKTTAQPAAKKAVKKATPAKPKEAPAKKAAAAKRPAVKPITTTTKEATVPTATPAKKTTARRSVRLSNQKAAKSAPEAILEIVNVTDNYVRFDGIDDEPLFKAAYITVAALEKMNKEGEIVATVGPFVPLPKGKQTQPTSAIRYTETVKGRAKPVFNHGTVYLVRAAAAKQGFTEAKGFTVTISAVTENTIKMVFAL